VLLNKQFSALNLEETSCHDNLYDILSLLRLVVVWKNIYKGLYFDFDKLKLNTNYVSRMDIMYDICQGTRQKVSIECYMINDVVINTKPPEYILSNTPTILENSTPNGIHSLDITSKRKFVSAQELFNVQRISNNDELMLGVSIVSWRKKSRSK